MRPPVRGWALATIGILLTPMVLSACTGSQAGDEQTMQGSRSTALKNEWRPDTRLGPPSDVLGLKWNWAQPDTEAFIESVSGGVTFHRTEWCSIQPSPGAELNFRPIDTIVTRATDLNYPPMLKIRIGSCWAVGSDQSERMDPLEGARSAPSVMPADLALYADYVSRFVGHFSAMGVHSYAIENEVDTDNYWAGTPADYLVLARTAAAAIRAADPEAVVLDSGVSSTGLGVAITASLFRDGKELEALNFYRQYFARRQDGGASRFPRVSGVRELGDVLNSPEAVKARAAANGAVLLAQEGVTDAYQLHYYEDPELVQAVVSWLREQLPDGFPIQAWETGIAWPGSGLSETAQADDALLLLAGLLSEGVTPAVYLPVAFTEDGRKRQVFRGLVKPDGTELPAAEAYRLVRKMVAGEWQPANSQSLGGIAADDGEGAMAVVWSSGRGVSTVPSSAAISGAQTLDGRPVGQPLEIGQEPIIVSSTGSRQALIDTLAAAKPAR